MTRTLAKDRLVALAAGLLTLAFYIPNVPKSVLQADSGEFQFAVYLAGLSHPTGYPLYSILGWLWSHLIPLGNPAYRLNLFSAVTAAFAVYMLCRLVLNLAPQAPAWSAWPAAAIAALGFATAPTFWSQSIIAEAYALNIVLLAGLLLAAFVWGQKPQNWWRITLIAGLGLAHHRTIILYLPICLLLVYPAFKQARKRDWFIAIITALTPLALYLYIPLRAPASPYLNLPMGQGERLKLYQNDLSGFIAFIMGQPFGNSLTVHGLGSRALAALRLAGHELSPLYWCLAVAGLYFLWRQRRSAALVIAGGMVLQIAFNLLYDIGDIYVLYIPVYFLACAAAGLAIVLAGSIPRRSYLAGFLALLLVFSVAVRLPNTRRQVLASIPWPSPAHWQEALQTLPENAMLVTNDRNEIMPIWYEQYVNGQRPDVTALFPLISSAPEYSNVVRVAEQALATSRPVYLLKAMPGLETVFTLQPAGNLAKITSLAKTQPQYPLNDNLAGTVKLSGCDITEGKPDGKATVTLYWQAAQPLTQPYSTYVHVLRADGSVPWPGSDQRPGGDYYPATLWRTGEIIRDQHIINIPADAAAGHYRLITGMYVYPSLESLGEAIEFGELIITANQ